MTLDLIRCHNKHTLHDPEMSTTLKKTIERHGFEMRASNIIQSKFLVVIDSNHVYANGRNESGCERVRDLCRFRLGYLSQTLGKDC
jgi:hypothetical protein